MTPCNTCQVYKLPQDFPMTIFGYRRHVCEVCYNQHLEKTALIDKNYRQNKRQDALSDPR
jgi:hypothetical protein